jgi:cold-inducible RNA-binding protein
MTQSPAAGETTRRVQVGNLPAGTTEAQVRALFLSHGTIGSYEHPVDAHTERPGGFAYFVMAAADATAAIKALNGRAMGDRKITVNLARPLADWAPGAGRRPVSQTPRRIVT